MVRTVNTGYSWHTANTASNTTTYAITVAEIPGGTNSGFEAMMCLIPVTGMSNPDGGSVDWDSANVAYFTINANADGTGKGNFCYKVNSPSATYNRMKITGAAAKIDETFGSLDPGTWVKKAASPQGVFMTAADAKYWLTWPLPDNGYTNVYVTDDLPKNAALGQWLAERGRRPALDCREPVHLEHDVFLYAHQRVLPNVPSVIEQFNSTL